MGWLRLSRFGHLRRLGHAAQALPDRRLSGRSLHVLHRRVQCAHVLDPGLVDRLHGLRVVDGADGQLIELGDLALNFVVKLDQAGVRALLQ